VGGDADDGAEGERDEEAEHAGESRDGSGRRGGISSGVPGRSSRMPTFILLSSLSHQGVQTLRSNPDRLREVNRDVEELGAKVLHQWATLGPYDFVNVVEAPDAATIARVSVALGARGSAKLQTLSALEIDEFLSALG
jgi:uncharacterized protein with GYD domain